MNDAALARLIELRNADGGWGTTAGRPSSTEPTALALLALAAASREPEMVAGAVRWLTRTQRDDGAWPVAPGLPEASWTTSHALMAIQDRDGAGDAFRRGAQWLGESHGAVVPWRTRFRDWLRGSQTVELDMSLVGWSWATDTFSWIEPTSWAILALRNAHPDPPKAVAGRIDEGQRLILDRTCPGGGWNYGNKVVLGVDIEPYPDTTAIALLALTGREDPRVATGLSALDRMIESNHSGLTLSLSALCYRAYGRDPAPLRDLIDTSFATTGLLDEVRSIALAVMAGTNAPLPFIVTDG